MFQIARFQFLHTSSHAQTDPHSVSGSALSWDGTGEYTQPGLRTEYQRLPVDEDRLLTAMIHYAPTSQGGGELARYDYTYTAQQQIATWRHKQPGLTPREWAIGYDARQQVTAVVESPVGTPPQLPQQVWRYQYDASGNRITAQEGSRTRTATYNNLNQLVTQTSGGTTWFRGKVNEPANVTINGQNARVYADGTFESLTSVGPGVQDVAMEATDAAGNTTSQTWRVDNGPAGTVTTTHDAEGNLLTDGRYTYTWDARNRMTSVTLGSDTWTFQYDGHNRRIAESKNGQPTRQWVWHGTAILEERLADATSICYWTNGIEVLDDQRQQVSTRVVLKDHLGSARVVLDGSTGAVTASYDYSPWGLRTRIQGTEDWGNGYTGHLWHESGLSLAVFRPYDPHTGRWPSKDPINEKGGLNLYEFAFNDPINKTDTSGLSPGYPDCCQTEKRDFGEAEKRLILASQQVEIAQKAEEDASIKLIAALVALELAIQDLAVSCVPPANPKCALSQAKVAAATAGSAYFGYAFSQAAIAHIQAKANYKKASDDYDVKSKLYQDCLNNIDPRCLCNDKGDTPPWNLQSFLVIKIINLIYSSQ